MLRLREWFITRKEYLTFTFVVIVSLFLLFSNNQAPAIQTIQAWSMDGAGLLLEKLSIVKRLNALYKENLRLRRENAQLMLENSRLKEAWLENQRLRNMLAFKTKSAWNLVPAMVTGIGENTFVQSIVLSVGKKDGIEKNMPVVTAQGLVGKIFNVSKNYSTAQLLLDRNFKVSAMVQRSRVKGIVNWYQGNLVELREVPKRSDVQLGDGIITSGYSAIFPKGIRIGEVIKVEKNLPGMFIRILVKPSVDFTRLEEVFVVRHWLNNQADGA
ncbi:MAG: rod shape-determining protein MreC [Calditrichaeota bacterium]|nr:MAG: rod shape-determining protein MreC [Calditrichota bacterium]